MSDEFIEDDFIEENEGAASNRPFLIAVGALVTVFILAAICALVVMNMRGNAVTNSAEVAAIETQNAITIVTNTAVAQFIAQTNTAQAMPSNTPAAAANTSTPTAASATADATSTPVIEGGDAGTATGGEGEGTAGEISTALPITGTVTSAPGTIIIGGDNGTGNTGATGGTSTAGSMSASGGALTRTAVPAATTAAQTGSQTGALPQTGLEIWVIALVGLLLVGVVIVVHRLRAN